MIRTFIRRLALAVTASTMLAGSVTLASPAQAAGDIDICVSSGRAAGFTGENFVVAVAVAMAESRCDPSARGVNSNGSIDRGLWQINSIHSDVSDSCAYEALCNGRAAYRISDHGTDWTPWVTYKKGTYKQFMAAARAAIGAPPAPVLPAKSINGDKYDDAIGVDPDGVAWVYPGTSGGGFAGRTRLGPGWGGFTRMGINDTNADGWADLWAIGGDKLYHWANRGSSGGFSSAVTVGSGWSAMENVAFADVNGDNRTDILARDGGNMYSYIGKGTGTFAERDLVSAGWAGLPRHTAADADADGDGDIWATNSLGELFFWKRNGGAYATAVQVGSGWNGFRQMVSMDINGDNKADLVAIRTSDDTLWQWLGTGSGTFGQATPIGNGWAGYDLAAN